MQHTSMLISVTGRDKPGITSALAGVLAQHHVRIRDIEQVTSGGNLTLSFMVQLDPTDVREHPFFKDFIFTAWELGSTPTSDRSPMKVRPRARPDGSMH